MLNVTAYYEMRDILTNGFYRRHDSSVADMQVAALTVAVVASQLIAAESRLSGGDREDVRRRAVGTDDDLTLAGRQALAAETDTRG